MNADAPLPQPTPATDPAAADAPLPAAPEQPSPAAVQPVVWPNWFRPFDIALGIFAVVLAFLLGSFVARNADLWRHLAAGRMVTQFQYPWGGDPFTFTAADRPWVNANWLGEVLLYLLHSVDGSGAIAVGVKAVAVAAAIGLLFLLRKPGAPIWPWAVAATAGAVALAGFTHLRPQVFALPIMAGILAVLYTADWAKGNKWRVPLILGGLTAVWANVDSFAFLSPLLVGLLWAGEWLHPLVFPVKGDLPSTEDPFRPAPPRAALGRALLLCVVGVLLNPTFVAAVVKNPTEAVAQLVPFELDWQAADHLRQDGDLHRYTYSALSLEYLNNPVLGQNPSGMFAIGLWVAGALAAGVGFRHGRLSHLLAWVVFTLIGAVVHARFVPYGVLVGVPFLAAHLNGLGRYVPPLLDRYPQAGRGVLLGSMAGRIVCLVAVVVLIVSAMPGWLHPWNGSAAGRRYVGWGIVPDDGMKRAGEVFAGWHADPARAEVLKGTHGLNTHPDLGDYLAYFAPAEKSFVTSRYRLHRAELKDLVDVRKQVFVRWSSDPAAKPPTEVDWLVPAADKYGIGYVSIAQTEARPELHALWNVRTGFGVRIEELFQYGAPWHLDGRLMVIGRTRSLTEGEQRRYGQRATLPKEEADEIERMVTAARGLDRSRVMTWDVAREVFGPRTPPKEKPEPMKPGVRPLRGWEYDLLLLYPPPAPVGLDDAESLADYSDQLLTRRVIRDQLNQRSWQRRSDVATLNWFNGLAVATGGAGVSISLPLASPQGASYGPRPAGPPQPTPDPPAEQEFTLPYLIARSARNALAVDPNAPFGHFALALAFSKPFMPVTEPPADLFGFAPIPPYDQTQRTMQLLFSDLRTRHGLFPAFGPSENQVQVLTALNRAVARLPEAIRQADEYTPLNVRARLLLVDAYLQVGNPQYFVTVRRVGNQLQPASNGSLPVGYIDSARTALLELKQLLKNAKPEDTLPAAIALAPLWDRVLNLCLADFWVTFPQFAQSGQVPNDWWEKINRNDILPLLVDRNYLSKDDVSGWQQAFMKDADAGKVDAKALEVRVERLYEVLNNLVGMRLARLPRAVDRPNDHYYGAIASGLPETALKLVEKDDGKEVPIDATGADALRLMLWVGRAESAQGYYDLELDKMERKDMPADRRAVERAKYRQVKYELAKLNGDYAQADVLYTELLNTQLGPPPPVSMTALMFSDLWRPVVYPPLSDAELKQYAAAEELLRAGNVLGGGPVAVSADITLTAFRIRLLYRATTHYQRGVYALLGGDAARAREQFEMAADPQGIGKLLPPLPADATKEVRELLPVERIGLAPSVAPTFGQVLPKYLELLKKYEKK